MTPTTRKATRGGTSAATNARSALGASVKVRRGPRRPLSERLAAKCVVAPSGCWEWTGSRDPGGYGRIFDGEKAALAHRVSFVLHRGAIPAGLVLDHLCRNPRCVNPDHLEPVEQIVNVHRGVAPNAVAHLAGTCTRGHASSEAYRRKGTSEVVYCRACRREQRAGL